MFRPDGQAWHRRSADGGVPATPKRPLAFVGALGDSRRHLCLAAVAVFRCACRRGAGRKRRAEDRRVGAHQCLPGGTSPPHPHRDLCERRKGSRDALGGGSADPPHDPYQRARVFGVSVGFVTPVPVRWSDIDMYQHVNHATMVTILEEARVPFLKDAFGADITSTGLLIADVRVSYKAQLRLADSPLQVTIWVRRLRAVDFTLGYEVRSVTADLESKPAVIAESQLAAFHVEEQRLVRLSPHHREYLARWVR